MGPNKSGEDIHAADTDADEKSPVSTNTNTNTKPKAHPIVAVTDEKAATTHGETLPGWTIMRPLKMRGLKKGSRATTANANAESATGAGATNGSSIGSSDKKDDLKVTSTNGSGDGRNGVGEVDVLSEVRSDDELLGEEQQQRNAARGGAGTGMDGTAEEGEIVVYKVYKRRWFGLVQLVLLNIIVSWDWLSFSANSNTVAQYYDTSESAVNWLSTGFLFAFVLASPVVLLTLHRGGPKPSIVAASVLLLVGNWIRYGATKAGKNGNFGAVMFGQILMGLGQPFVLTAPTRYSDLWFTNRGRVAATAVMSLANPFGGALAQLIDPFWADKPHQVPDMVLYIAIIATIACVPSFFIPARPPTPPSASGHEAKQPLIPSLKFLFTSPEFYMIMIPYTIYVGLFNSLSSLINQMLEPYSFSETDAGIAGALLIVVGLVASAITSPIIDKTKTYLLAIKICVPVIAIMYLAFTWGPSSRSLGGVYAILSILGAASFSLVPVVLEYLTEITHPVSPEVTSTICWTGGQLLGAIFILVSDAVRDGGINDGTADDHTKRPPGNMYRALVFQTVMAMIAVPLPLCLGLFGRGHGVRMRRIEADKENRARREGNGGVVLP